MYQQILMGYSQTTLKWGYSNFNIQGAYEFLLIKLDKYAVYNDAI